jgi:hypothetical protein
VPRFYFHFSASGFSADDRTGTELASLAAAHRHAVCVVDQATRYLEETHDWSRWTVRICDETGGLLLTVLFRSCLKDCVRRQRRRA